MNGELIGNNAQEIKKLQIQVAKLEQMIGKLTMENYILKKEKEYILQRKKENSSIISGPYLNQKKEGCRLMGIKRATLYYLRKIDIHRRQKELKIRKKITNIFREYPYYGYRRITARLRRNKLIVNHKKVLRIMKEMGIQGRIKRKLNLPRFTGCIRSHE